MSAARIHHLYRWMIELYEQASSARAALARQEFESGRLSVLTDLELFASEVGPLALRAAKGRLPGDPISASFTLKNLRPPRLNALYDPAHIALLRYAEVLNLLKDAVIEFCENPEQQDSGSS